MPSTIFISAGEASGEHYGALLIDALKTQLAAANQSATFVGMGGPRMAAAGLQTIVRSEDMAVMGLTEVVLHLPRIYREFRKLKQAIRQHPPSVAVLIDFPEIHFRLAKEFHRLGVPVIFFVSPQLWAWKKHRIKLVHKYIDKMLVIFPFEEPFYRERGIQAEFVGHPLAELPLPAITRQDFAAANALDPAGTWIGLLPGSRPKEIRDHLPTMLKAASAIKNLKGHGFSRAISSPNEDTALLAAEKLISVKGTGFSPYINAIKSTGALAPEGRFQPFSPETPGFPVDSLAAEEMQFAENSKPQFLIPLAPTLNAAQREEVQHLVKMHGSGLSVRLVHDARATLFHARVSVVASGTATVEAALIGNPFIVVYRVSALTYAIAKRVVKVPFVAMANLIAGKQVVPELIQSDFTAENIVQHIEPLLPDGPPRQSMMQELAQIRSPLQVRRNGGGPDEACGAIERVAAVTMETIVNASMNETEITSEGKARRRYQAHGTARAKELNGVLLAAPWQRFVGFYFDLFLAVVAWWPLEYAWHFFALHEKNVKLVWDFHELGNVIVMLLYWGLGNYFGNGRTLGKWIARTRILSLTSERLGLWQSFERALGYGAAVLEGGLGVVQIFWDRNRMCAQDRLAETIVVDLRRQSN